MTSFSVDTRDQSFVLYELLEIEQLLKYDRYSDYDRSMFDMALDLAVKLTRESVWPTFAVADREGATIKDGEVKVPACFHALRDAFIESGLAVIHVPLEQGGQGMPLVMDTATREHFIFNMGFNLYMEASIGAANLIAAYGSAQQKATYMEPMYTGKWGGTMALTEPGAGTDVGALTTRAIKQADGTYRLVGAKILISGGDSDLYTNIIHPVLARIEGDPAGSEGVSIFLVPKFLVNPDGSLGRRNDYTISGIEHKMGLKGSATCSMSFGDHQECYGEILGEPRQGLRIMFQMMNEARIGMGVQGVGTASLAYLQALKYAKERIQSVDISKAKDPSAPKVPIIRHPDVRRMLMWMKTHVEGMRGLVYFCSLADDKAHCTDGAEAKHWHGIRDLLIPLVKAYCTDVGFRVTDLALQTHGGYGYTQDYPIEQLMRDMKIGSIYEGTNGVQALDLVGRKLTMNKGETFKALVAMIQERVKSHQDQPLMQPLAGPLHIAIQDLVASATYFYDCATGGKPIIPVVKAYPFLNLFGTVALGWFHYWAAAVAAPKFLAIASAHKVDPNDPVAVAALAKAHADAAFYLGKLHGATFYMKNVLPEAGLLAANIKNNDLSLLAINDESFAS